MVTGESSTGSVVVRSPTVDRRQALMLGAVTPKSVSRNLSCEVWSKTSEHAQPPAEKGETTSMGTRTPSPMGPAIPSADEGSGSTVRYSPSVPAGAVGGGTWSKNPSFSSYMMNSTVLAHTSGLDRRVSRICCVYHSPSWAGAGGCSS